MRIQNIKIDKLFEMFEYNISFSDQKNPRIITGAGQLLRARLDFVAERLATRGVTLDVTAFQALEDERKTRQTRTQELQARRNALSKQVGQLKGKGEDASAVLAEVAGIGDELKANEVALADLMERFNAFIAGLPNLPHDSVPVGRSEEDNVEVSRWGTPASFDFEVRDHVDIGTRLGGLDFETAVKISGARFTLMKGGLARLHRALAHQALHRSSWAEFVAEHPSIRMNLTSRSPQILELPRW